MVSNANVRLVTNPNAGDAQHAGGNDWNYVANILNGTGDTPVLPAGTISSLSQFGSNFFGMTFPDVVIFTDGSSTYAYSTKTKKMVFNGTQTFNVGDGAAMQAGLDAMGARMNQTLIHYATNTAAVVGTLYISKKIQGLIPNRVVTIPVQYQYARVTGQTYGHIRVKIYDDSNGGSPGIVIAESASTVVTAGTTDANHFQTISVSGVTIPANGNIYIGIEFDGTGTNPVNFCNETISDGYSTVTHAYGAGGNNPVTNPSTISFGVNISITTGGGTIFIGGNILDNPDSHTIYAPEIPLVATSGLYLLAGNTPAQGFTINIAPNVTIAPTSAITTDWMTLIGKGMKVEGAGQLQGTNMVNGKYMVRFGDNLANSSGFTGLSHNTSIIKLFGIQMFQCNTGGVRVDGSCFVFDIGYNRFQTQQPNAVVTGNAIQIDNSATDGNVWMNDCLGGKQNYTNEIGINNQGANNLIALNKCSSYTTNIVISDMIGCRCTGNASQFAQRQGIVWQSTSASGGVFGVVTIADNNCFNNSQSGSNLYDDIAIIPSTPTTGTKGRGIRIHHNNCGPNPTGGSISRFGIAVFNANTLQGIELDENYCPAYGGSFGGIFFGGYGVTYSSFKQGRNRLGRNTAEIYGMIDSGTLSSATGTTAVLNHALSTLLVPTSADFIEISFGYSAMQTVPISSWTAGTNTVGVASWATIGTLNQSAGVGASNNGSGLIRITLANATHPFVTGDIVVISGIAGGSTTEANGTWTITVIDNLHFDLQGSAFVNAYVLNSGGIIVKNPNNTSTYTIIRKFTGLLYDLVGQGAGTIANTLFDNVKSTFGITLANNAEGGAPVLSDVTHDKTYEVLGTDVYMTAVNANPIVIKDEAGNQYDSANSFTDKKIKRGHSFNFTVSTPTVLRLWLD